MISPYSEYVSYCQTEHKRVLNEFDYWIASASSFEAKGMENEANDCLSNIIKIKSNKFSNSYNEIDDWTARMNAAIEDDLSDIVDECKQKISELSETKPLITDILENWLFASQIFEESGNERLSSYCMRQFILLKTAGSKIDNKKVAKKVSPKPPKIVIPIFPICKQIRLITLKIDKSDPVGLYTAMGKILRSNTLEIKSYYFALGLENGLPYIRILVFSDVKKFRADKMKQFWPSFECDKLSDKTVTEFYKELVKDAADKEAKNYCSKYKIPQTNIES